MRAVTWTQRHILMVYARYNMSRRKTAESCFLSLQDIDYHLRMVEIKTGLNPHNFKDLVKLIFMCGDGGMFELDTL